MSNSKELILIVEDEEAIADGLIFNFEAEHFQVKHISDGASALDYIKLEHKKIATIVLDLMLPELNGYEILKNARYYAERIPILILSAKSMESEKVRAFELGADDFVTKPFHLAELILRVKRLVQRRKWYLNETKESDKLLFGLDVFDPHQLTTEKQNGDVIRVSPMEGLLIQIFIQNQDKILTRPALLRQVWQYETTVETRTVDVFVGKLRKYIEKNPARPEFIISVRGAGYSYVNPKT